MIKKLCFSFLLVVAFYKTFAQVIAKPTFQFSGMCARPASPPAFPLPYDSFMVDFNIFSINLFVTTGANPNKFFLEMSDSNGSFANPTTVVAPTAILTSPGSLNFIVPANLIGSENYKFRVKSTNPALTSPESAPIFVYYKPFNDTFYINKGISTATICDSSGVTIAIDNPISPPASLSNVRYNWFKNNVLIIGQTGTSIVATSAGVYRCEINYGSCSLAGSSISAQPAVTVNVSTFGNNAVINASPGTVVSSGNPVTLSAIQTAGLTYQWYKNNIPIPGATNYELITTDPGSYYLQVANTLCSIQSDNTIVLTPYIKPNDPTNVSKSDVIPNIVSPNNDGFNYLWELPREYSNNETSILILDAKGIVALQTDNYINNWPQSTPDFDGVNAVYYYVLTPKEREVKRGSITVLK